MFVLIAERDDFFRESVVSLLRGDGHATMDVPDGESALAVAKDYQFDLMLLGMKLPDMAGHECILRLRRAKLTLPLIATGEASASSVDVKARALMIGADDFIERPLHSTELLARMNAVSRRSKGHATSRITVGSITVDLDSKELLIDGLRAHISNKLFQLLELLITRAGQLVTRETIMNNLYCDPSFEPVPKIIDVFVSKLRKALGVGASIETVWGRGYMFVDPARAS